MGFDSFKGIIIGFIRVVFMRLSESDTWMIGFHKTMVMIVTRNHTKTFIASCFKLVFL